MESSKGASFFSLETIGGKALVIVLFLVMLAFFLLLFQGEIRPMINKMARDLMSGGFTGG